MKTSTLLKTLLLVTLCTIPVTAMLLTYLLSLLAGQEFRLK